MVGMELQQRSWNTSSTGVVAGISEGLTGNMASCSNAVFETALFDLQLVCVCVSEIGGFNGKAMVILSNLGVINPDFFRENTWDTTMSDTRPWMVSCLQSLNLHKIESNDISFCSCEPIPTVLHETHPYVHGQ